MTDPSGFGGGGGGEEEEELPAGAKFQLGRQVVGLGIEPRLLSASPFTVRPEVSDLLESNDLIIMANELGFPEHSFGLPSPASHSSMMPREPTDAEALYLQVPPTIPLAIFAMVYGSSMPTLLWTDLGLSMQPESPAGPAGTPDLFRATHTAWWRCLNAIKGGMEPVVSEPANLVFTGTSFDDKDFSIQIGHGDIKTVFSYAPRALVTKPVSELGAKTKYREIVDFGFAQAIYFHSMLLFGMNTGLVLEPAKVVFAKPKI